jgi:hypothetical protein
MADVEIFNQDIAFITEHVNRYIDELTHSQSSPVNALVEADKTRLVSYIAAMRHAHAWIQSQPQLDLPETHPRPFKLEPNPVVPDIENDAVAHCVRMLEALRTEMVNSQSARMSSRLQPADSSRFTSIVDRLESFLVDYIGKALPLDLPESSPQEGMTTPGQGGT